MKKQKYFESQAVFTIFFDSDFEPNILNKILNVNASKIIQKKDAVKNLNNPKGLGVYQIATNVADSKETEIAVATVLRVFISKVDMITKICKENNGFMQLDLFVKLSKDGLVPNINLSKNAIKLLAQLNAQFNVKLF